MEHDAILRAALEAATLRATPEHATALLSLLDRLDDRAATPRLSQRYRETVERLRTMDELKRGDFRQALRRTTETVASALGFARVGIFRAEFNAGKISGYRLLNMYLLSSETHTDALQLVPPSVAGPGFIPTGAFQKYEETLLRQPVTFLERSAAAGPCTCQTSASGRVEWCIACLSAEAEPYLVQHNITMMSDSSIRWRGQFLGLLCCEHLHSAARSPVGEPWAEGVRGFIAAVAGSVVTEALLQAQAATHGGLGAPRPVNFKAMSCWTHIVDCPVAAYLSQHSTNCSERDEEDVCMTACRGAAHLSVAFGFLPGTPRMESLPSNMAALEDYAAALPQMYRSMDFRSRAQALPDNLARCAVAMDDRHLERANVLLGVAVHACHFFDRGGRIDPPKCLTAAWDVVCQRVGKLPPCSGHTTFDAARSRGSHLAWADIVSHNWCFKDSSSSKTIADVHDAHSELELLCPVFGSATERSFLLGSLEMEIKAIPLIGLCREAQAAMLVGDDEKLTTVLWKMRSVVDDVTAAFVRMSPCPYSPTYLDPVEWGLTLGTITMNISSDEQAASGRIAPLAHLVDAIIGRDQYESSFGKSAALELDWIIPKLQTEFFKAVRAMPVREYVKSSENPALFGAFHMLVEAWSGEQGFWEVHRLKAFNFMEANLKTGRIGTTGSGEQQRGIGSRAWVNVCGDRGALNDSRHERSVVLDGFCPFRGSRVLKSEAAGPRARRLTFDLSGTGLRYEPGDTVLVWPRNSPKIVDRTLDAFGLSPKARIRVTTPSWRNHLLRHGHGKEVESDTPPDELTARDFLMLATLRPLSANIAMKMLDLAVPQVAEADTAIEILRQHVGTERGAAEFEVWDFALLLGSIHVDLKSALLGGTRLAELLPPLSSRQYSITSAPELASGGNEPVVPHSVKATVGVCEYAAAASHEFLRSNITDAALGSSENSGVVTFVGDGSNVNDDNLHSGTSLIKHESEAPLSPRIPRPRSGSVRTEHSDDSQETLLTVELAAMQTHAGGGTLPVESIVTRRGVSSSFLMSSAAALSGEAFPIDILPHTKFRLPRERRGPVLMVANGTGVAPMISFLHARSTTAAAAKEVGETVLFWGVADPSSARCHRVDLLEATARSDSLTVHVVCSRANVAFRYASGKVYEDVGAARRRVATALHCEPSYREILAKILRKEHCMVYICGVSSLAKAVWDVAAASLTVTTSQDGEALTADDAHDHLNRIAARGGWCLDVFDSGSSALPWNKKSAEGQGGENRTETETYNAAAVHSKNRDWTPADVAITCIRDGRSLTIFRNGIYDLEPYLSTHPGGHKILLDKLGRCCTNAFYASHGISNLAIMSQFEMFRCGDLRTPPRLSKIGYPLLRLWEEWRRALWLVVEIRNFARLTFNRTADERRPRTGLRQQCRHQDGGAHAIFITGHFRELCNTVHAFFCGALEVESPFAGLVQSVGESDWTAACIAAVMPSNEVCKASGGDWASSAAARRAEALATIDTDFVDEFAIIFCSGAERLEELVLEVSDNEGLSARPDDEADEILSSVQRKLFERTRIFLRTLMLID